VAASTLIQTGDGGQRDKSDTWWRSLVGLEGRLDHLVHLEDIRAGEHLFGWAVGVGPEEVLALRPAIRPDLLTDR